MARAIQMKILDERIKAADIAYGTPGAAAFDLRAAIHENIEIPPNASVMIPTGVAMHLADAHLAGMILPRSGLGAKKGLILGNLVGLIDSDYQGQLMVSAWNRSEETVVVEPLMRFAQMVIVPVVQVQFEVVSEFEDASVRGDGGFSSTGVK